MTDPAIDTTANLLDEEFSEWSAGLTPGERCDLRYYQANGYTRINGFLRRTGAPLDEDKKRVVDIALTNIDAAMDKGELVRPVTVYRGVRDGAATLGMPVEDALPGTEFTDFGYASTSLDPAAAVTKAGPADGSLMLQISLTLGQHAAWMPAIAHVHRREYELLLPRGTWFRVVSSTTSEKPPMITLEVVR
jgi:hypothetical protein